MIQNIFRQQKTSKPRSNAKVRLCSHRMMFRIMKAKQSREIVEYKIYYIYNTYPMPTKRLHSTENTQRKLFIRKNCNWIINSCKKKTFEESKWNRIEWRNSPIKKVTAILPFLLRSAFSMLCCRCCLAVRNLLHQLPFWLTNNLIFYYFNEKSMSVTKDKNHKLMN